MSLIKDIKYDIAELDISIKSLRKFGLLFVFIFAFFGVFFIIKRAPVENVSIIFFLHALIFAIAAAAFPLRLKRFYIAWMGSAFFLGWIISRILMIVIFYFIITPTGLLLRLFRKDLLDIRFRDGRTTYWKEMKPKSRENYEQQF